MWTDFHMEALNEHPNDHVEWTECSDASAIVTYSKDRVYLCGTRPLGALVPSPTRCRVETAGSVGFGRRQPVESISVGIDRRTVEQHTFRDDELDVSERECSLSGTAQRQLEKWLRARAGRPIEGEEDRVFYFLSPELPYLLLFSIYKIRNAKS